MIQKCFIIVKTFDGVFLFTLGFDPVSEMGYELITRQRMTLLLLEDDV